MASLISFGARDVGMPDQFLPEALAWKGFLPRDIMFSSAVADFSFLLSRNTSKQCYHRVGSARATRIEIKLDAPLSPGQKKRKRKKVEQMSLRVINSTDSNCLPSPLLFLRSFKSQLSLFNTALQKMQSTFLSFRFLCDNLFYL